MHQLILDTELILIRLENVLISSFQEKMNKIWHILFPMDAFEDAPDSGYSGRSHFEDLVDPASRFGKESRVS